MPRRRTRFFSTARSRCRSERGLIGTPEDRARRAWSWFDTRAPQSATILASAPRLDRGAAALVRRRLLVLRDRLDDGGSFRPVPARWVGLERENGRHRDDDDEGD